MANAPFVINPALTAIAVAYRNSEFIADRVAPRFRVAKQEFKWQQWNLEDGFTVPDTAVGRRGQPGQLDFGATEQTGTTQDHGLDAPVPQADIDNADQYYDPEARATEGVMYMLMMGREKRVADQLSSLSTYKSTLRTTLSGTSQWSDYTNSDPIGDIEGAKDSMIGMPNVLVLGLPVWSKVRRHPKVIKAVQGPLGTDGLVTTQQLADALELDEIIVGRAQFNTARRGQTVSIGRIWGKHASLIRRDQNPAGPQQVPTFMWTAQWGSPIAGRILDPDMGVRGGFRVRAAESVREVVSGQELGYLWRDAVA